MKTTLSSATWRKHFLDRQHAEYLRTGNAIYAWRAFQIARSKNEKGIRSTTQVPEWVLDYFDRCAAALPQADSPKKVAQALGLSEKVKQQRRKMKLHGRDQRIVEWILDARERELAKPPSERLGDMDIFHEAEEKFGVVRVRDIFYKERKADEQLIAKLSSS